MTDHQSFFKDKRITLLGLGRLGRGVGDAAFLAECGARVLVTDRKSEGELAESVARLKQYKNVSFRFGEHRAEDFTNCDMVIKAAGVRLDSPYIDAARRSGKPVYMSTALFAKYAREAGATIVGVTGTRGKSTIAHMIYHAITMHLGLDRAQGAVGRTTLQRKVVLGGNVRGVSTLALLPQIQKGDIAVLELDSWQLQGFGDLQISPHIAIFTNLMPDHLNYYPDLPAPRLGIYFVYAIQCDNDALYIGQTQDVENRWREHCGGEGFYTRKYKPVKLVHYEEYQSRTEALGREKWLKTGFGRKWLRREWKAGRTRQAGMETYFNDKAQIFRYQKPDDVLLVGADIQSRIISEHPPVTPTIPSSLPETWWLAILGEHNRANATFAAAALKHLGLSDDEIKSGLESFTGVEGRLQLVGEIRGVKIYNDNNATTPEATIAAIRALDAGTKNVILIMGGADKGLSMTALWKEVLEKCKDLYFLGGSGTERIKPEAPHVPVYQSVKEAFDAALAGAESGDSILFSPAFASFGMFQNEYDRNDQFLRTVSEAASSNG